MVTGYGTGRRGVYTVRFHTHLRQPSKGLGGGKNRRKRRRNRNRNRDNEQNPQQAPFTPAIDPEELVRRAWKIYLGEVTEEGLALMDDRTAAEASRRAFRVAELFLTEAARRRRPTAPPTPEIELVMEDEDEM